MSDIIVNDESYSQMATLFSDVATLMENRLTSYVAVLDDVGTNGVIGGHVHDNLVMFKMKVSALQGQIQECMSEVQSLCTQYVESIDEADSDLY